MVTIGDAPRVLRSRFGAVVVEAFIAVTVLVAATTWGAWYWNQSLALGRHPFFYQLYFEPAVMLACGKGFVVAQPQIPSMGRFLAEQTDTFDCADIPANAKLGTDGMFQGAYRYLMTSVGLTWKFTRISWRTLGPLAGVLFGITIAAAYAIFRLGMGRVLSALLAWLLSVSTLHVTNLPHILDYSKAPFFLLVIFLMGLLVRMRPSWRGVLATSVAAGIVLGIGYGFRSDPLIAVPAFVLTLALFLDARWRERLRFAAGGCVAFLATFFIVAAPVIYSVQRTWNCQWHTVIIGLGNGFTHDLQLEPAAYDWMAGVTDEFVAVQATSYAARLNPGIKPIEFCSPEYGDVTRGFMLDVVRHSPADFIVRAYASALQMVQLPLRWRNPPMLHLAVDYYKIRKAVTSRAPEAGVFLVVAAVFLITASSLRLGLFLVAFLLYFGGYPAIQFGNRHFFHFEFITWWAFGFLLQQAVASGVALVRHDPRAFPSPAQLRRAALVLSAVFVSLVTSLWLARLYQHASLAPLVDAYVKAEREPLIAPMSDGVYRVAALREKPTRPETADLVEIDVNEWQCPAGSVLKFVYDRSRFGFAHDVPLNPAQPHLTTRIAVPVFFGFQGVSVADAKPECIAGLQRITHPERFALMPALVLRPGWEREPLHQSLIGWGIEPPPDE